MNGLGRVIRSATSLPDSTPFPRQMLPESTSWRVLWSTTSLLHDSVTCYTASTPQVSWLPLPIILP